MKEAETALGGLGMSEKAMEKAKLISFWLCERLRS